MRAGGRGHRGARGGGGLGAAEGRSAGHAHARASQRALWVGQGCRGGEDGEAVSNVLSTDRWSNPGALAAGTGEPRAPLGVVLGGGARVHPTLLVHHPLGWCPGPAVGGFAPGTQPVGRGGEYSRCGVVWCGVPKALLPQGNGRDVYPRVKVNGRAVCVARAPSVSVWLSADRRGVGETWMSPSWRQLSSHKFPLHSLSLHLLVQAELPQHPRHRAHWAQAGFRQRGTRHAVGVPDSDGLRN